MATEESLNFFNQNKQKNHDIPIELLDYKYIESCTNVKELEKIYKVLVSGVEGKFPDLENFAYEKLKNLSPNSRALRKDLPITSKKSIPLSEQNLIDNDIENFVKSIPTVEQKILNLTVTDHKGHESKENNRECPPIRATKIINPNKSQTISPTDIKKEETKPAPKSSNKSPKPKDYGEWNKIEKELEKELENNDEVEDKKVTTKVTANKTIINQDEKQAPNKNLKDIPKKVETDHLDENVRTFKADQEKCKGNEAFNAGSYEEALVYYTRSIQYLPNSASYNNRALAYLKLEKWDKAIEDCQEVLTYEPDNIKALLRRSNAYFKKKSYQEARYDIDKCLSLNSNDKKAQDLKMQIETALKKDTEEKEKVKSLGGNRLKIEDTDGSEEEIEEIDIKTKAKTTQVLNDEKKKSEEHPNKKKQIEVTEVDTDDDDEEEEKEEKEEKANDTNPILNNQPKSNVNIKVEQKNYELSKNVVEFKDKAFKFFSNGQYGDAVEYYTKAIEQLNKDILTVKDDDEKIFLKNNFVVLLNNRASSSQKICEFKSCIKDCDLGLDMLNSLSSNDSSKNLMLKLLSKKADSYEKLEKFTDAFLVYENLMKIDSKFNNVQQSYNRIRNVLKDNGQLKKIIASKQEQVLNVPLETKMEQDQEPLNDNKVTRSKEEIYEENKLKGNEFVRQSNFEKAIEYYTNCIEIDSVNPVAYLNRSLCFIKCDKADLALKDSNFVLKKDSKNVKALFRRAMSYKMKLNYDLACEDLTLLINLENNNQIAIHELEELKRLKNASSKSKNLKETPIPSSSNKKIVVLDEDLVVSEKKTEIKEINKNEDGNRVEKVVKEAPKITEIPSTLPTVRKTSFGKITNAYEFLQFWNSIKPQDINSFAHLLVNVKAADLPKFIGSKLDDAMLATLIKAIEEIIHNKEFLHFINGDNNPVEYLKFLAKSQRFNVIKLFLNQEQKNRIIKMLSILKDIKNDDINSIKKDYDL